MHFAYLYQYIPGKFTTKRPLNQRANVQSFHLVGPVCMAANPTAKEVGTHKSGCILSL